ncbi:MAG: hypothetical protein HZC22_01460 [Rhodocyclales bacterium]|nr:hypothetical protein [Rhodocyclales bacterium]
MATYKDFFGAFTLLWLQPILEMDPTRMHAAAVARLQELRSGARLQELRSGARLLEPRRFDHEACAADIGGYAEVKDAVNEAMHTAIDACLQDLRNSDPEACAATMVEYAEANDDPDAWKMIAVAMEVYVAAGRHPPFALTQAITAAMKRWRLGESIAVVFGEKRGKHRMGARPAGLDKIARKQANATLVESFMSQEFSQNAAAGKVQEWQERLNPDVGPESILTITSDHNRYKKK